MPAKGQWYRALNATRIHPTAKPRKGLSMRERETDTLVVGAGRGGVAAALAVLKLGKRVMLSQKSDWIGGQLTAQAAPPDEHP